MEPWLQAVGEAAYAIVAASGLVTVGVALLAVAGLVGLAAAALGRWRRGRRSR